MDKSKYICPNCGENLTMNTSIVARIDNVVEWNELELDEEDDILLFNKIDENTFPTKAIFCCDNCQAELDLTEAEVKEILKLQNERDNKTIFEMNLTPSTT